MNKTLNLFLSTFKISASTFGGGFVIVPLLKKRFVDELGWLEEEEVLDLIAIAQSSPGPIAVNASVLIGYKALGFMGALTAILGTVLPPLFIISIISMFYKKFRDSKIASLMMTGMLAGVAAVLVDVVIRLIKGVYKERSVLSIMILLGSFVALRFLGINILLVILSVASIGVICALREGRKAKNDLS